MAQITIDINRLEVYDEVSKLSEYAGAKAVGDDGARERITACDEDLADLGRMWDETVAAVCERLKDLLADRSEDAGGVRLTLHSVNGYNPLHTAMVQLYINSSCINHILGQWYRLVNKEEAEGCMVQAAAMIDSAQRLLHSRMRPQKPQPPRPPRREPQGDGAEATAASG